MLILADMGSSIMSAETAMEFLEESGSQIRIADAPVLEGAVSAAVTSVSGADLEEVAAAAEETRGVCKLS